MNPDFVKSIQEKQTQAKAEQDQQTQQVQQQAQHQQLLDGLKQSSLVALAANNPELHQTAQALLGTMQQVSDQAATLQAAGLEGVAHNVEALVGAVAQLLKQMSQEEQTEDLTPHLEDIKAALQGLDIRPQVTVQAPAPKVSVDLGPLATKLDGVLVALKELSAKETPEPSNDALEAAIHGVQATIENLRFPVPNYVLPFADSAGKAKQVTLDSSGNVPVSGSFSITGSATSANQTNGSQKTQVVDGSGNVIGSTSNALDVNIKSGSSAGTQYADGTARGTATGTLLMVDDGTNIQSAAGTTAGVVKVDLSATTGNSTAVKVDGSAVTQPVSGSVGLSTGTNSVGKISDITTSVTPGTGAGNLGKGQGQAFASSDVGVTMLGVRNDSLTNRSTADGQYLPLALDAQGRPKVLVTGLSNLSDGTELTSASGLKVVVNSALPAGTNEIGGVNLTKVAGTTADTNSGVKGAGTLRVVLATDQPQLTNKLLVTPDANSAVNVAQINGITPLMGNGTTGTGSQRVTIASDNTAFSVNAVQSGTWTVQPGNTANTTPWLVNDRPATSGGLSIITGSVGATPTAIKASAGQLYGYHLFNTTAAVAYVQIFNVAFGSVTLGTTAPTMSIGIPASGGVTVNFDKGIAFGTAMSFACTTTRAGLTGATCDVNFVYN